MVVGVDGCRNGWLAVARGGRETEGRVFAKLADLAVHYLDAALVLIDIPIGLFDTGRQRRECDADARRELGWPRSASVFPAPLRAALGAAGQREANASNLAAGGGGIGAHQFGILAKIAETDQLLGGAASAAPRLPPIRECHPEVCFWALNHRHAMEGSKKKPRGREEREDVLRQHIDDFDEVLRVVRAQLVQSRDALNAPRPRSSRIKFQMDDVLDALVAAVTAERGVAHQLLTLPAHPSLDVRSGLAMEMVYWLPVGE
jgi:predicted RNase H-like nuclease